MNLFIIDHPYAFVLLWSVAMFAIGVCCGCGLRVEYCRRLRSKIELYKALCGEGGRR